MFPKSTQLHLTPARGALHYEICSKESCWQPRCTSPQTLALLGIYQLITALQNLVIQPSMNSLGGIGGDAWTGRFDYTLQAPVSTQFLVSFQRWRLWGLVDVVLSCVILGIALTLLGGATGPASGSDVRARPMYIAADSLCDLSPAHQRLPLAAWRGLGMDLYQFHAVGALSCGHIPGDA